MKRYSAARRESVIQKMMLPHNIPIPRLVEETGISDVTLYTWRKQARVEGIAVPADGKNPEKWSSEDKFAIVLEAAPLNEAELAEYCRRKGLYVEQIAVWRKVCLQANTNSAAQGKVQREQTRKDRRQIKQLEQELHRMEKALAETAALLVLQKKAQAIWGDGEDE
jgi:transposase-like protein